VVLAGPDGAASASAALSRNDPASGAFSESTGSLDWVQNGECGCLKIFRGDREWLCFGTVVSVADSSIAVREYDFAADADAVVVYAIIPETESGNLASPAELSPGDSVVLDYVKAGESRVITTLTREAEPNPPP
jgi:hypothetical protein